MFWDLLFEISGGQNLVDIPDGRYPENMAVRKRDSAYNASQSCNQSAWSWGALM